MSVLESTLPSFQTSSLFPTYKTTSIPQTSTNNNHISYSLEKHSTLPSTDLNNVRDQSYPMPLATYTRTLSSISKPNVFNQKREKERFELSTLNDKFADYVEKVRYLESQNKKIQMDTNLLHDKQQANCQRIKTIFDKEITQLKERAEKLFHDKNATFTAAQIAQDTNLPLKQQLNQTFKECDSSKYETEKLERQLSSIEGDIVMYNRRLVHQDREHAQWKQLIAHIQRLLLQAKNEIHNEILTHRSCEQQNKQLRVDITRLYEQQQEEKFKDFKQSPLIMSLSSTSDRALMFRSELSNAIRRIRQEFEIENDRQRNELYEQFACAYENIIRQYPELEYLKLNEHEQERIQQEEEQVRKELERIRTNSQLLKQKNAEFKLRIRELQIKLDMNENENKRIQQLEQCQINQWKLKHEKITKDYDDVISKQISLEQEIETYRNLLEGTMKPVVDCVTDDYQSMNARQAALNKQDNSLKQSIESEQWQTITYITDVKDTDSYIPLTNKSPNDNETVYSSTTTINISTETNQKSSLETHSSVEGSTIKINDNDLQIVEAQ